MIQTPISFRWALHKLAFIAALPAALAASPKISAADKSLSHPTIAAIQVGIQRHFKVGCWTPIRIEAYGIDGLDNPRVAVSVPDSDGVPTTATAPLHSAVSSNDPAAAVVYTKVGRIGSSLQISLMDGDRRLDERTLLPGAKAKEESAAVALPSTAELLVSFGPSPFGLKDAFLNRESDTGQLARRVVELDQVVELPTDWFGYDAADVLLISTGDGKLCRELAADAARIAALSRWVELGGRLVLLSGGQTAQELFAEGRPLARFAPGKLAEIVRLRETGPLEHFAGSAAPISTAPAGALRVPRFVDVSGNVELASDLPIVIRSPFGLGEVAFVGIDFSQPPLAGWSGRTAFLQALLRPYLESIGSGDVSQRLVTRGYNDLDGALRQRLGQSFAFVAPIGLAVVASLAVAYIIFLGPLDYLFINRWVRRPWVAWVSFPLIVMAFSAAALSLAEWRKGPAGSRANRLELVDVDTATGRARGTFWATLYSPTATRFDISVQVPEIHADSVGDKDVLFSWWGLPGIGIGGMQTGGVDLGIVDNSYFYGPDHKSLEDLPVLSSATKSLMARWTARLPRLIDADLSDRDGLAVGSITNRTGATLRNVQLLYQTWAYRLGNLNAGQRVEVGEQLSPRKVKTVVTHEVLGDAGSATGPVEGRVFSADQASPEQILNLMMFYDAAGGFGFAHLPNRYQAYCDLSRLLELGRAILVADSVGPATQLVDNITGNAIGDRQDESTVIYRFVLPVNRRSAL